MNLDRLQAASEVLAWLSKQATALPEERTEGMTMGLTLGREMLLEAANRPLLA